MLMIISPTKKLKPLVSDHALSIPCFAKESEWILKVLKKKSLEELMNILCVKDTIAYLNKERYLEIDYDDMGTAALLTYYGIQFKYINLRDFNDEDIDYANAHLRILSGFYGVVKPLDSIYPYRLEMQAKLKIRKSDNLYDFWDNKIMKNLREEVKTHPEPILLDLSSQEYARSFVPYLNQHDHYVRITFRIQKKGKLITQATQAKMARGQMVHDVIKQRMETLADIKTFHCDGYCYQDALSNAHELVFVKEN